MKTLLRALALASTLLSGCAAGEETVIVGGHVVDDAGEPVEGVQVWIGHHSRTHEDWDLRDVTGEGGRYELTLLAEPGDLQVKLEKHGYEGSSCSVGGMPVLGPSGQPHHPLANDSMYDPMRISRPRSE